MQRPLPTKVPGHGANPSFCALQAWTGVILERAVRADSEQTAVASAIVDESLGAELLSVRPQTFDRPRTADELMSLSGRCPTLIAVQESIEDRRGPPSGWSKLSVFCICGHSEFIHSDRENRVCLWSECHCSAFVPRSRNITGPTA